MNTHTNSNTKHFCTDCGTSLSACKSGFGNNVLPCQILRKIAKKTTIFYNKLWVDENLMPDDCWTYCRDKMWKTKYVRNQKINFDAIIKAIAFAIYTDYSSGSITVDEMFEYEDNNWGVSSLASEISNFQYKLREEWFSVPGNKELYINALKDKMKAVC